jgi:acetyl-CoA acetyltransferase
MAGIPLINVENACAGGATAFHSAWHGVASGMHECALAVGAEKMYHQDKAKMFGGFLGGIDVEGMEDQLAAWTAVTAGLSIRPPDEEQGDGSPKMHSAFMDIYSAGCRWHMENHGTTPKQLAQIASKNHAHSARNPKAQYRNEMSVDEILAARPVSWPFTVPMCAPVGDGSAAAVLCSHDFLKRLESVRPIKILASVLGSGTDRAITDETSDIAYRLSRAAYEKSGVGPQDINVAEVHDATAFGELHQSEALGFCEIGQGGELAESGETRIGGRIPINPSGGLESRGHPIGASGLGQIYELITQLRHQAGPRQVDNCRLALAENGGGNLGFEEAAMAIHILERVER